jgi:hypothetical protein
MKTILSILALLTASAVRAYPGPQINGNQINPQTGITVSTLTATGTTGVTSTKYTATATPGFTGDLSGGTGLPAATGLTGQVPVANGGTALSSAGGTANRVLRTSDGSTFQMGQVIGPDVAASTIPANALNQSGATDGQVMAWSAANGSWGPSTASVGTVTTQGSPAAGQVAVFQAGTVISTGPISYTPSAGLVISSTFSISTFTFLTADYTSVTRAAGVCLPGSTITWTASGTLPAMLHFGGGQVQTFNSASGQTNILVDGQYVDGYGPSVYMWWTDNTAAVRDWFPVEINHRMTSILSAGSHSACLSTQSDSGGPRGLNCDAANHARCYFRVYETHE